MGHTLLEPSWDSGLHFNIFWICMTLDQFQHCQRSIALDSALTCQLSKLGDRVVAYLQFSLMHLLFLNVVASFKTNKCGGWRKLTVHLSYSSVSFCLHFWLICWLLPSWLNYTSDGICIRYSSGAQSCTMEGREYAGFHSNQSLTWFHSLVPASLVEGMLIGEISRCSDWLEWKSTCSRASPGPCLGTNAVQKCFFLTRCENACCIRRAFSYI